MRVLVTGGSGFIGRHIIAHLSRCFEVINLDIALSPAVVPARVIAVSGDIRDRHAVNQALVGVDAVVHLAAIADVDFAITSPAELMSVNVAGTQSMLDVIRASERPIRFIHASTVWVYGDARGVLTEDSPLPLATHVYTASKIAAECLVLSYIHSYGLTGTILRFGIPFGPGGRQSGLIPSLLARGLKGLPLQISGTGKQTRQFVPIRDLASAVELALTKPHDSHIFNLAYDVPVSVNEVASLVHRITGGRSEIEHIDGRSGDQSGSRVSSERAHCELGWRPAEDLETALNEYLRVFVSSEGR